MHHFYVEIKISDINSQFVLSHRKASITSVLLWVRDSPNK